MIFPCFLRHSFLILLLFFVGFSVEGTFAAPPSTAPDITKPGYMIELGKMDPVDADHTANPSDYSGK